MAVAKAKPPKVRVTVKAGQTFRTKTPSGWSYVRVRKFCKDPPHVLAVEVTRGGKVKKRPRVIGNRTTGTFTVRRNGSFPIYLSWADEGNELRMPYWYESVAQPK